MEGQGIPHGDGDVAEPAQSELERLKAEFRDPATPDKRKPEIHRRFHGIYYDLPAGSLPVGYRPTPEEHSTVLRLLLGDVLIARSNLEYAQMGAVINKVQGRPLQAARWREIAAGYARRLARIQGNRPASAVSQPRRRPQPGRPREHRSTGARSTRGSPKSDEGPSDPPPAEPQPLAEVAAPSGNLEVLYRVVTALEAVELADYGMAEAVLRDLEDDLRRAAA
jgi:hypothetical protein